MEPMQIDVSNEQLPVRTLYPSDDFWKSDEDKREQKRDKIRNKLSPESNVVAVHDTDVDGLGAAVMVKYETPTASLIPRHHSDNVNTVREVGQMISDIGTSAETVLIMDNGCDKNVHNYIEPYLTEFSNIVVYDHHEWPDDTDDVLTENDVEYVIDNTRCATRIVCDEYVTSPPDWIDEFADVTQDHDLWIKEDARSDRLATFSYAASNEEYIETILENGMDFLSDEETRKNLIDNRKKTQRKINLALQRSRFYYPDFREEIEEIAEKFGDTDTVTNEQPKMLANPILAITYGDCPQSDIGNELYDGYGADIVCIMKPDGGLSFRSDDTDLSLPMATMFNGGGHNNAAGGWLKDTVVNGDTQYEKYWATMGECIDTFIIDALKEVCKEEATAYFKSANQ